MKPQKFKSYQLNEWLASASWGRVGQASVRLCMVPGERSTAVNTTVVKAATEGLVMNKNANLLICNGGGILLTRLGKEFT